MGQDEEKSVRLAKKKTKNEQVKKGKCYCPVRQLWGHQMEKLLLFWRRKPELYCQKLDCMLSPNDQKL